MQREGGEWDEEECGVGVFVSMVVVLVYGGDGGVCCWVDGGFCILDRLSAWMSCACSCDDLSAVGGGVVA